MRSVQKLLATGMEVEKIAEAMELDTQFVLAIQEDMHRQ